MSLPSSLHRHINGEKEAFFCIFEAGGTKLCWECGKKQECYEEARNTTVFYKREKSDQQTSFINMYENDCSKNIPRNSSIE